MQLADLNPPLPDDADVIISEDTLRPNRVPPGQHLTSRWPVLHAGPTPTVNLATWEFAIFGPPLVAEVKRWSWDEFQRLPRVRVYADMHCVTTWSKLGNVWEGVSTQEVLRHVSVSPSARFVMVHAENGFTTNLPIEDFLGPDCLFAFTHNGEPLDRDHGGPVRLVVPRLYAWKSAKWVRGLELMERDAPGFWENWSSGGYHMRGDPWTESRFRDD